MGDLCVWEGMHKIGARGELVEPMFGGSSLRGDSGGEIGCSMEGMEEVLTSLWNERLEVG